MKRSAWHKAAVLALLVLGSGACELILSDFHTFDPPGGTGGSTTGSSSTSGSSTSGSGGGAGGACFSTSEGSGMVSLTDDMSGANLPTMDFSADGSVSATYYMGMGYTELRLATTHPGYCDLAVLLDIAGLPVVGEYTVVATSPYEGPSFAQGSKNAYLFAWAKPTLDGGCDTEEQAFGSSAGSGTVQITSVEGTRVKFTVTSVQATGISDPTCAGMMTTCNGKGTIQITIQGEARCLSTG